MRRTPVRWRFWCLGCLLTGLVASFGRNAPGPYEAILGGNVFRLKAPEAQTLDTPAPPLAEVRLTGITTLFAHKLALLKVRLPGKGPEAPQELGLSLEEGQSEKNIQVLSIDERAGRVELLNGGTRAVVAFQVEPPAPRPTPRGRPLPLRTSPPVLER